MIKIYYVKKLKINSFLICELKNKPTKRVDTKTSTTLLVGHTVLKSDAIHLNFSWFSPEIPEVEVYLEFSKITDNLNLVPRSTYYLTEGKTTLFLADERAQEQ